MGGKISSSTTITDSVFKPFVSRNKTSKYVVNKSYYILTSSYRCTIIVTLACSLSIESEKSTGESEYNFPNFGLKHNNTPEIT